ncbi:hypothetical protein [Polaromonas sp. CG_9.11]|uniref:hypothetical protein n=1 Tax=Polaromonas sp. CG_9.11 TaxID=2787730 RepID=UPI0018CAFF48|nr:hypothetical protein [Polaromonas sp. CG_9.11]MBG6075842.1 hypothetical protein [Polaromonas sp. CG_9.11]
MKTGAIQPWLMVACLWLAGCAGPFNASGTAGLFRDPGLSMQAASGAVVLGQSSKDDVLAVLGPATVVRFDSAYEVWVYRQNPLRSEAANAELVILFDPSGRVKKSRVRPAYAPQGG